MTGTNKTEPPRFAPEQKPASGKISPNDVFGGPGEDGTDIIFYDDIKDLTESIIGRWPGNPSQRQGSFSINLKRLNLKNGEVGMLGYFPEGFVFERVDMHSFSSFDKDLNIEFLIGTKTPETLLEVFYMSTSTGKTSRQIKNSPKSGCCVGNQNIYLKMMSDIPNDGRILVTFVGYMIETWR